MFNFFHKKDDQIRLDVETELNWDARIDASDIAVSTKNGMVTLTGTVPHFFERYNAEDAAHRVGGVKSVCDKLEVSPPPSFARSDAQITDAANSALAWNYQVPDGLSASVANGWVTLSGQVDWDYQRNAANDVVAPLMGVCGVINEITLKPKDLDKASIKTQIQDALKRSATIEGNNIDVSVSGDKVTLSGKLDSYDEIETARIAAWNAPGVTDVVNNIALS